MVDRTWFRSRVKAESLGQDGGVIPSTTTTSGGYIFPASEEGFKEHITKMGLNLSATYDCATVEFSYEHSHPQYGVAAYKVTWNFIDNHLTNHKDVLYYALIDMDLITPSVITDVIGNRSYLKVGVERFGVWNVLSEFHRLKSSDGRYTTYPHPILAVVATAIGFEGLESKVVGKNNEA
jgi:hypothetical protein